MEHASHLHRFQRLDLERQPLTAPSTREQLREELERDTREFIAQGGRVLRLPQNAHGIDMASLDVEQVHHLHNGPGPSKKKRSKRHAPRR